MELQKIREKLDKIDRSINYLIFLRTSAAVLVGETKKEQDLPIFQPKREKEIYQRQKVFAEERGINEQLLIQISKLLIEEFFLSCECENFFRRIVLSCDEFENGVVGMAVDVVDEVLVTKIVAEFFFRIGLP